MYSVYLQLSPQSIDGWEARVVEEVAEGLESKDCGDCGHCDEICINEQTCCGDYSQLRSYRVCH